MSGILRYLARFRSGDDGAVTVDWVVLTAAAVGLGLATVVAVRNGTGALATDIDTALSGATVATLGSLGSDGTTGGILAIDPPVLTLPPPP